MAILKTTVINGNLFVTGSDNFVSASSFKGNIQGTASFADSASEAAKANVALDVTSSADLHVNTLRTAGDATIGGNLVVSGNLTYIGVTDLRVKDKFIELNSTEEGQPATASADGAGIVIRGSEGTTGEDASITYDEAGDQMVFNKPISASINATVENAVSASHADEATSASLAAEAKKVSYKLKVGNGFTASGSEFDGSEDVTLAVSQSYIENIKVNSASVADTASRTAGKLSFEETNNRVSGGPFDGSEDVTMSIDLSGIDNAVAANATASANAQATASEALASASANASAIEDLVSGSGNYVKTVTEGTSVENFVTLSVATGSTEKDIVIATDDSALKTKIDEITGSLAEASESAATAQSTANDATASAAAAQETANEATASAAANSSSIAALSGSLASLEASDIPVSASSEVTYVGTTVQEVLDELDGRTSAAGITVEATGSTEEYAAIYNIKQGGTTVGTINIPKDYLVKSGEVKTCEVADVPVEGLEPGDKYLDFVVNASDGSGSVSHIYIPVEDLVDIYQGATTSEIAVTVDDHNFISASIVEMNGSKLTTGSVTKAKLADAVTASLDLADTAVQTVESGSANGTISVDGTDVAVTGLGSAAYEDATAFDASGAAETAATNAIASGSASLANEVSRSMAAESEISSSAATALNVANQATASAAAAQSTANEATASAAAAQNTANQATASAAAAQETANEALASASVNASAIEELVSTSGSYVKKAGDTMSGDLNMAATKGVNFMGSTGDFKVVYNQADEALEFIFTEAE